LSVYFFGVFTYAVGVTTPSSATPSGDAEQVAAFLQEGLLDALHSEIRGACIREHDVRHHRFRHPRLNRRGKGNSRWDYVDEAMTELAPAFGFTEQWVPTGLTGHPEMLFLKRGTLLLSAHQSPSRLQAPPPALHRTRLMRPDDRLTLFGPLEEESEVDSREIGQMEWWPITYQRTKDPAPRWLIIGRASPLQKHLRFHRDIGREIGFIEPDERFSIQLNPVEDVPNRNFTPTPGKKEGEGDL